ncbi:hypothetical protein FUA26_07585 [Seonamhaeicola algicola]|uniref:Lipoprotein n=1 Tax=Seonamhaeicola algicola TaxID=1719036 RepID=A0A5C7AUB4_9FLAO|nr:hypothetical protein [Seonamhaeicola algicola]TXE11917.1 hypothetical protein FUA26_07585 [Seonamhaeicola algicola]
MLRKAYYILVTTILLVSCSSNSNEEECVKTITVQNVYFVNNQSHYYDSVIEVPCNFPEPGEIQEIEPLLLENFTYNVLLFKYTKDTGNNTSKLEFQIQLNNLNDFVVKGVPYLTIKSDGLEFSTNYGISSCNEIAANSSCIISFETEDSHDLGIVNSIELLNVEYYLTN